MLSRQRLSPEETRTRIVEVAEEQFRRMGYAKTTVADLAQALGMSSANIYRFFPSKGAINDAICRVIMDQANALAGSIVEGGGTAAERLRRLVIGVHRFNKGRFTDEHRLHDMVQVAMDESWPAVEQHKRDIARFIAMLVAEGMKNGEFAPGDAEAAAQDVFHACVCLFHPVLIAQSAHLDSEFMAERMARFVLEALKP